MAAIATLMRPLPPAAGPSSSSQAGSLLALLKEDDRKLQVHALKKLYAVIDTCWAEASDMVAEIEALAEDDSFPARELASAVASKCYYHLEAYENALQLALGAGAYFDVNSRTEYVETIISKCIDMYQASRVALLGAAPGTIPTPVDPRLERVVDRMFARCLEEGAYRSALGVALETQRLDVVEDALRRAVRAGAHVPAASVRTHATGGGLGSVPQVPGGQAAAQRALVATSDFLTYGYELASSSSVVSQRSFRFDFLRVLVKLHSEVGAEERDHAGRCKCLQALNDAPAVASVLLSLLQAGCTASTGSSWSNTRPVLLALQIAFDIVDSECQEFAVKLHQALPPSQLAEAEVASGEDASASSSSAPASLSPFESALSRVKSILDGSTPSAVVLDFLSSNNKCDHVLLSALKKAVDPKNSVLHGAIVSAHGLMNAGTTHSGWLNSQMEWLRKASNWSRFGAVASAGVMHRGHLANAMRVLQAYLPRAGSPTESPFAEGGALYALGIIHAGRGAIAAQPGSSVGVEVEAGSPAGGEGISASGSTIEYLSRALTGTMDETVQHGACLGLGLAALGTGNDGLYSMVRNVLMDDKAVAGEAAGLCVGLLLLGQGPTWRSEASGEVAASEMLGQAHNTEHEKIVRGIGIGLALMCYGLEDAADDLIRQLTDDKDAVLRFGGMYAIGLAYAGTANNAALKKLLHVAVSDVSDDVRRAAVMNIGFILARQPGEVPVVVGHLAESYNPHVRYGACLALGIACAGTGATEAISLLEPLAADGVDYVRQGAYIALGMVLQCEGDTHLPRTKVIRDRLIAAVQTKGESTMAKMGAIIGLGLMDAGGRNCVASIISRGGFQKSSSVVGLALFTLYWYWFPLLHSVSLALSPSGLLGLTGDLRLPSGPGGFSPSCSCPPSWFAYPTPMSEAVKDKKEAVTVVELSTAAKARARARGKEEGKSEAGGAPAPAATPSPVASEAAVDTAAPAAPVSNDAAAATKDAKKEKEADTYVLANPCRVSPGQAKFVLLPAAGTGQRFVPLLRDSGRAIGVTMLVDTAPSEALPAEDGGDTTGGGYTVRAIRAPTAGEAEEKESLAPKTFEWTIGDYAGSGSGAPGPGKGGAGGPAAPPPGPAAGAQ